MLSNHFHHARLYIVLARIADSTQAAPQTAIEEVGSCYHETALKQRPILFFVWRHIVCHFIPQPTAFAGFHPNENDLWMLLDILADWLVLAPIRPLMLFGAVPYLITRATTRHSSGYRRATVLTNVWMLWRRHGDDVDVRVESEIDVRSSRLSAKHARRQMHRPWRVHTYVRV